ncbi:MAG: hypothetical protein QE271_04440 [Bacteriovoracaceae bacterium]|nr:hypothetical protein [Bacteriovoracaceae bacterium]
MARYRFYFLIAIFYFNSVFAAVDPTLSTIKNYPTAKLFYNSADKTLSKPFIWNNQNYLLIDRSLSYIEFPISLVGDKDAEALYNEIIENLNNLIDQFSPTDQTNSIPYDSSLMFSRQDNLPDRLQLTGESFLKDWDWIKQNLYFSNPIKDEESAASLYNAFHYYLLKLREHIKNNKLMTNQTYRFIKLLHIESFLQNEMFVREVNRILGPQIPPFFKDKFDQIFNNGKSFIAYRDTSKMFRFFYDLLSSSYGFKIAPDENNSITKNIMALGYDYADQEPANQNSGLRNPNPEQSIFFKMIGFKSNNEPKGKISIGNCSYTCIFDPQSMGRNLKEFLVNSILLPDYIKNERGTYQSALRFALEWGIPKDRYLTVLEEFELGLNGFRPFYQFTGLKQSLFYSADDSYYIDLETAAALLKQNFGWDHLFFSLEHLEPVLNADNNGWWKNSKFLQTLPRHEAWNMMQNYFFVLRSVYIDLLKYYQLADIDPISNEVVMKISNKESTLKLISILLFFEKTQHTNSFVISELEYKNIELLLESAQRSLLGKHAIQSRLFSAWVPHHLLTQSGIDEMQKFNNEDFETIKKQLIQINEFAPKIYIKNICGTNLRNVLEP